MKKICAIALIATVFLFSADQTTNAAERKKNRSTEVTPSRPQVKLLGDVRTTKIPNSFFYEKVSPMMKPETLLAAGYISVGENPFGSILEAQIQDKDQSIDDLVFIDRGSAEGVEKGDRFFVYRRIREVPHPATGDMYGHLITILGEVEVVNVNEPLTETSGFFTRAWRKFFKKDDLKIHSAACKIVEAYNVIHVGDMIVPSFDIYVPTMDEDRPILYKEITGKIAAVGLENQIGSRNDIVYLTIGRRDGVDEGDVFAIYKAIRDDGAEARFGYKDLAGKAKIVTVRDRSATAIVTFSKKEIYIGDNVSFIQER